ncbi:prolipoprotein diacylglyceryl transferase [Fulvivirgaceae bacterium QH1ED-6-2]|nr:prolipoprotein diacylglyceryl transferase [Parachryseolinea silvisoli]MCD9017325.1 prolipoprotein diacylglyceryl transferase [Parachryseolinea silvisoli]
MSAYIIWDIDPEIFAGVEFLRWYGFCWALGMMLGYQVMLKIYKREAHSQSDLDNLTIYIVLGVIIGARLGHILFYDPIYYLNNPMEILPIRIKPKFEFIGFAGLASHGGVLGALSALYLYSKKHKKDFLWTLDRLTIAGSLLGCSIRLGNLMNSEIIGIPAQVPWAFVFIRVDQIPRHPAQLYEALFYLLIFSILFHLWRSGKIQNHKGFLFGLGLSLIFAQRFMLEFLKENQKAFEENWPLNMGQMLSVPLVIIGISIMVWSFKKSTRQT